MGGDQGRAATHGGSLRTVASIDELVNAKGEKSWKVYWDLPKFMVPEGQKRAKGSLTVNEYNHALMAKDIAENAQPRHSLTGDAVWERLKNRLSLGEKAPNGKAPMTFAQWTEEFRVLKSGGEIRKRTLREYNSQLDGVILPRFGPKLLSEITGADIKRFLDEIKTERNLTFARCDRYYALIKSMLQMAVKQGYLKHNVAFDSGWKLRKRDLQNGEDEHAERFFTIEQYGMLTSAIREDYRLFVKVLGETGARFSEITNLQVKDLNLGHDSAWIRYNLNEDGEWELPKSGKKRLIEVPPALMKEIVALVEGKSPEEFVFTTVQGKQISNTNFRRDIWDPAMIRLQQCPGHMPRRPYGKRSRHLVDDPKSPSACECLGSRPWTKFTPHALRHSYATWMLIKGRSITLVCKQLGHNNTRVTESIYAHLEHWWKDDKESRLSNTLDDLLGRESDEPGDV